MRETVHRLASTHTGNERTIWVRKPLHDTRPCHLLIFLDGELYRDRVGAPSILDGLEQEADFPDTLVAYVSAHSEAARWLECPCHPPFADFIIKELVPWLRAEYPFIGSGSERVLAGLSYTGLAAAFIALQVPGCFTKVIAQSGSFWSNDCWLVGEYSRLQATLPTEFYLDVGTRETQENVRHKEDVLQVVSQIEGVEKFRDILRAKGHEVHYQEFDGAHDCAAWEKTLPVALRWALANSPDRV
jgi:enterochelin esterase-like enzyme